MFLPKLGASIHLVCQTIKGLLIPGRVPSRKLQLSTNFLNLKATSHQEIAQEDEIREHTRGKQHPILLTLIHTFSVSLITRNKLLIRTFTSFWSVHIFSFFCIVFGLGIEEKVRTDQWPSLHVLLSYSLISLYCLNLFAFLFKAACSW